jgi:hypothetical protein
MNSEDWASTKTVEELQLRSLADQAPPVRRTPRGAKHRAAGTGQ